MFYGNGLLYFSPNCKVIAQSSKNEATFASVLILLLPQTNVDYKYDQ